MDFVCLGALGRGSLGFGIKKVLKSGAFRYGLSVEACDVQGCCIRGQLRLVYMETGHKKRKGKIQRERRS